LTAVSTAFASAAANAHVSESEWLEFKAQFAAMAERVSALEAENRELRELSRRSVDESGSTRTDLAKVKEHGAHSAWSERVSVTGDFRYRYEEIDVEGLEKRERNRIRARALLVAKLPDSVDVGLGVASGSDDPLSANQTLGNGNTSKDVRLDLAYFKWNITPDVYLQAGKYQNPLYQPQKTNLLWDSDWRPEGFSAGWNNDHLFATLLGNWLESDSKTGNDEFAWGLQGGTSVHIGASRLTAALGYYSFPTSGNRAYYDDDFFGNSNVDGVYLYDYDMLEFAAELTVNVFDMPLSLFGDVVQNQDAGDDDTGWRAGLFLGETKGRGTWQLAYQYQDLEADAVLGLLSDSDFTGGGTDGRGHRLSGAYGINRQWHLGFTWFVDNRKGEKNLREGDGALDYDRFFIDTVFKY
ncbi:MAG: putative porin, partial [Halioglobus sp.]|nr:putative porin [Halioglobus sp.]